MFARTSSWTGSPEALKRWGEQVRNGVLPFVQSLEGNVGAFFLLDRTGGKALTLTLWQLRLGSVEIKQVVQRSPYLGCQFPRCRRRFCAILCVTVVAYCLPLRRSPILRGGFFFFGPVRKGRIRPASSTSRSSCPEG